MNDLEYDIIDELYFLISFEELMEKLGLDEVVVKRELYRLVEKGWVKMLDKATDMPEEKLDYFDNNYKKYNYLASKAGLLAHNSR